MKLNSTLVLISLAFAGASASAAPAVGTWISPVTGGTPTSGQTDPTIGPGGALARGDDTAFGTAVDDIYNFNIAATSDLLVKAQESEIQAELLDPANFELFKGTYGAVGSGGVVGGSMSFAGGALTPTTYANLAAGSYYIEVTGTAAGLAGSNYTLEAFANTPANPLPSIPEPTNVALMLAGLGLFGFMAKRRAR